VGLIVDYGYLAPGYGDTLQAVKANAYADPLAEPGEADLTAHVDFAALKDAACAAGADICGPITQSALLDGLGIHLRAAQLKSAARPSANDISANDIDAAVARLTGETQMGNLFKAMALLKPGAKQLPGFSC
jgi:NADH dehydrogenase [ubiquinone] 1 alpha subcomplex assembly factor 7